jgi:hypothetical protein
MNNQTCIDKSKTETNKALEVLDLARSHTGRAVGLFVALGVMPGVSWHDAAIAAISISTYALWQRCENEAQPGETGADVLASMAQKQIERVAPRLAPVLAKVAARVKTAIQSRQSASSVVEIAPSHTEPVLPVFGKSKKGALSGGVGKC